MYKSFEDLKMIEGVSFREAYIRKHLLTDDSEYIEKLLDFKCLDN